MKRKAAHEPLVNPTIIGLKIERLLSWAVEKLKFNDVGIIVHGYRLQNQTLTPQQASKWRIEMSYIPIPSVSRNIWNSVDDLIISWQYNGFFCIKACQVSKPKDGFN